MAGTTNQFCSGYRNSCKQSAGANQKTYYYQLDNDGGTVSFLHTHDHLGQRGAFYLAPAFRIMPTIRKKPVIMDTDVHGGDYERV